MLLKNQTLTSINSKVVFLTYLPLLQNKIQYISELTITLDFRWNSKVEQYTQVHVQKNSDLNYKK